MLTVCPPPLLQRNGMQNMTKTCGLRPAWTGSLRNSWLSRRHRVKAGAGWGHLAGHCCVERTQGLCDHSLSLSFFLSTSLSGRGWRPM
jgi:hypothetical protein